MKFDENPSGVESDVLLRRTYRQTADGRTDGHDEPKRCFSQF